ncbi:hypothetical protein [Alteromonas gilva]|uniref:Lipoprotein n=1 Tax=Alteromonas gilva TaxID=2987522 RepID=A0ABT5L733_9ALTE|nr:hypothetical protein [Alteromonas gilva]MDC8832879.1 hypothetical protein [Alteromonas gilva]
MKLVIILSAVLLISGCETQADNREDEAILAALQEVSDIVTGVTWSKCVDVPGKNIKNCAFTYTFKSAKYTSAEAVSDFTILESSWALTENPEIIKRHQSDRYKAFLLSGTSRLLKDAEFGLGGIKSAVEICAYMNPNSPEQCASGVNGVPKYPNKNNVTINVIDAKVIVKYEQPPIPDTTPTQIIYSLESIKPIRWKAECSEYKDCEDFVL